MTFTKTMMAVATLAMLPVGASAFTATNFLRVKPVAGSVFEVIGKPAASTGDYWCAAAQYINYTGTLSATQRIYVVRALGRSETTGRSSAVQFSTQQPAEAETRRSFVLSVSEVGETLSAAAARSYCYERKVFNP